MTGRPPALAAYRLATSLAEPFLPQLLKRRLKAGKEDPFRVEERLGRPSLPRPPGPLVWLHGASVGESLSHLPLVERFRRERPDVGILVTSGTRTSAQLLERRLPPGVIHQYAPLDAPRIADRFVEAWRPDLAIFVESELWPNQLQSAKASGARLALMSARLSAKSRRGWDRSPASAAALLGLFDLITAQDEATAAWIGRHAATPPGRLDLKRVAAPLPVDEDELERLRRALAGRPILLAASTHPGEELLIAEIAQQMPGKPLLLIAPRHPERGQEVLDLLRGMGLDAVRRSERRTPPAGAGAYVADTLGELGLFYRLADAVVLGGSFRDGMSGHNPLEPARLGKPVISGPHVASFAETFGDLQRARGVLIARGPGEFAGAVAALLTEPGLARALGERAQGVCIGEVAAFDAAWADLQQLAPAP